MIMLYIIPHNLDYTKTVCFVCVCLRPCFTLSACVCSLVYGRVLSTTAASDDNDQSVFIYYSVRWQWRVCVGMGIVTAVFGQVGNGIGEGGERQRIGKITWDFVVADGAFFCISIWIYPKSESWFYFAAKFSALDLILIKYNCVVLLVLL